MARAMKDSGIEWIGQIPQTWTLAPARYGFSEIKKKNTDGAVQNALQFKFGTIIPKSNFDADSDDYVADTITSYTIVEPGTVMINGLNLNYDFKTQRTALVKEKGVITSAYLALWPDHEKILPQFATYLFKGYESKMALHNMGAGIRLTLGFKEFKRQPVLFPEIKEQQRIVAFLDRKLEDISTIIAETEKTIEEYKALKQSIITEAVTKGVRGERPMKDSGIAWIKRLPVEWCSINPKALFKQRKDKATAGEKQLTASQQLGVIYQEDYMAITGSKIVTVEKDFDILKHVEAGDFVISMRSFQGGLEYSTLSGSISSAYVMLIPELDKVFPRFFRWLLKSPIYINALQSTSNMVRDGQAMRYSNFAQVRLYTVPLSEQQEIADYLDAKCAAIDKLIADKQQLLTELETYKKSVIYEYVTGKKDVPACQ